MTRNIIKITFSCICLCLGICAFPLPSQAQSKLPYTVVIDAGHGGNDTGAADNGALEKDINLGVAKKLEALIKKNLKSINVVMTRSDDSFKSLQERADIANRNKGNLFISIHTNSVDKSNPNRKSVHGASVYALGLHKDDANLKVAQRENAVIELESNYSQKYSGFDPNKDESYIIFEMAQKSSLGQSLKFADKAQKELVATAGRADRGVKQAGFWVLWATSMPSVLVELDFICNPESAAYLNSEEGQQQLAEALFNALKAYTQNLQSTSSRAESSIQGSAASSSVKNKKGNTGSSKSKSNASKQRDSDVITASNSNGSGQMISDSKESNAEYEVSTLVATSNQPRTRTSAPESPSSAKREYSAADRSRHASTPGSRKRRSATAKKNSDARDLEASDIQLKKETDYLAIKETSKKESTPSVESSQDSNTSKKGKKNKQNKKSKSDKNSKSDSNRQSANGSDSRRSSASNHNKKTFVVKRSDATQGTFTATNAEAKPSSSNPTSQTVSNAKAAKNATSSVASAPLHYKIQVLASAEKKDNNDPAFCGLVPSAMFMENGMYKYTYGDSTSRAEIEALLLKVKSLIPDAFIIMRN